MINNLLSEVNKIYIAYGITDFRKQISSLCNIVQNEFNMNPYDKSAYIFVTKKETLPQKEEKDDRGLVLPRNVSCNWCIKTSEYYLENIWKLMFSKLKQNCQLIHIDETTIQCNHEANKKASSNSYMWVMTSDEDEKCKGVIFRYSPSRAEKVAKELLSGYLGIIVTDGYAGYNNIENTTHAECWAHARRYFYESIPSGNTNCSGYEACVQILKKFYEWVYLTSQKYTTNKKSLEI